MYNINYGSIENSDIPNENNIINKIKTNLKQKFELTDEELAKVKTNPYFKEICDIL